MLFKVWFRATDYHYTVSLYRIWIEKLWLPASDIQWYW